ncbi:uncharacterized protein B0H18DRAFT_956554 [Fomitopsis serialis]|uniref:uncharacterized protein n=1 Tax=Fomitopsis serialis TaxID=139415 RepID=UPI0020087940|nr:uncharacterized protein B0H18DRAFT_956554 [Neoantrodia serialis]KAH9921593.1 hypothetical protein B0H18DRAFT_956554 [Neoantrodia serialis]
MSERRCWVHKSSSSNRPRLSQLLEVYKLLGGQSVFPDAIHVSSVDFHTYVLDLIKTIVSAMEASPQRYIFGAASNMHLLVEHERQPLQLLGFRNKGSTQNSALVTLKRQALTAQLTLSDMLMDKTRYFKPDLSLEDGHFVVHFTTATSGGESDGASDGEEEALAILSQGLAISNNTSPEAGNTADNPFCPQIEDAVAAAVPSEPTASLRRSSRLASSDRTTMASHPTANTGSSNISFPVSSLQRTGSIAEIRSLPPRIWTGEVAFATSHASDEYFDLDGFADNIYAAANPGDPPAALHVIAGPDVTDVAAKMREYIEQALESNDFSQILAPERQGLDGRLRQCGQGIEREVLQLLFEKYSGDKPKWFESRADERSSIATSLTMAASRYLPANRTRDLGVLGAVAALMMINGAPPEPLDPVFLHYCLNDCDITKISPELVGEWHPDLKEFLQNWLSLGPTDDIRGFRSFLAQYLSLDVQLLQDRSEESHHVIAVDMLYRVIVGTEPPEHPELQAFMRGLRLACKNGFSFPDAVQKLQSGAQMFYSLLWVSSVSSYDSLLQHVRIRNMTADKREAFRAAVQGSGCETTTPESLLADYLKGSGVPCPHLFEQAKRAY